MPEWEGSTEGIKWTWGSPGEAAVWGFDHHYLDFEHFLNLDEGDGEVVRGGVEPLDGGDHAAVVNCAQELRLVKEKNLKE